MTIAREAREARPAVRDNDVSSRESFTWELNESGLVGKRKAKEGSRKPQSGLPGSHTELLKGEALMT